MALDGPKCGKCYYFGFAGLERVCLTPDDPRSLQKGGPAKCSHYEPDDAKAIAGTVPRWKPRLAVEQYRDLMKKETNITG